MQQRGVKVLFGAQTLAAIPNAQPNGEPRTSVSDEAMGASAHLVIVVGGDGSLLGFGREMAASGVPVVGVNRGGLGFLAAISPEQIENKFGEILDGQFTIEEHFLLQARVLRDGEVIAEQSALNDVVISPGGVMGMMHGRLFEKVGVHVSTVFGAFSPEFAARVRGAETDPRFYATGVSLIAHMRNPHIPAVHMNTRFITTTQSWFGGGMDATPSFSDINEKIKIHKKLKELCLNNKKNYEKYKKWCDKYFYLPHRKESRGIGGIFFDYEKKNWENNFKFVRELGLCFIEITKNSITKKIKMKWKKKDKEKQSLKRGRYVEFNLLYDRGTKFGLNSGGNTESILMSLPPLVRWEYDYRPKRGSPEEELTSYYLKPRDWLIDPSLPESRNLVAS